MNTFHIIVFKSDILCYSAVRTLSRDMTYRVMCVIHMCNPSGCKESAQVYEIGDWLVAASRGVWSVAGMGVGEGSEVEWLAADRVDLGPEMLESRFILLSAASAMVTLLLSLLFSFWFSLSSLMSQWGWLTCSLFKSSAAESPVNDAPAPPELVPCWWDNAARRLAAIASLSLLFAAAAVSGALPSHPPLAAVEDPPSDLPEPPN